MRSTMYDIYSTVHHLTTFSCAAREVGELLLEFSSHYLQSLHIVNGSPHTDDAELKRGGLTLVGPFL
jgi:hypothetical protein